MQAVSVAVPAQSAYPSLLPGPFILLLALPAIPLLLFSVGARPPDTFHLPFSTDELWQTTTFITVAGAVVLCVGLYPGLFQDVGGWVAGRGGFDKENWLDGLGFRSLIGGSQPRAGGSRKATTYEQYQTTGRNSEYQTLQSRQMGHGRLGHTPHGVVASGYRDLTNHNLPRYTAADEHRTALRKGIFAAWYSPTPPSRHFCLIVFILIATILIIALGKILGNAYDADKKSSSSSSSASRSSGSKEGRGSAESWPARELRKRKSEKDKPEETKKRVEGEVKSWRDGLTKMNDEEKSKAIKKREQEVGTVKGELEKRKLSDKGLELYSLDKSGRSGDSGKGEVGASNTDNKKDQAKKSAESSGEDQQAKGNGLSKIKGLLKNRSSRKVHSDQNDPTPSSVIPVPPEGPGWKAADDAVAHAAIRGGAARAEDLGNKLVAQKKA